MNFTVLDPFHVTRDLLDDPDILVDRVLVDQSVLFPLTSFYSTRTGYNHLMSVTDLVFKTIDKVSSLEIQRSSLPAFFNGLEYFLGDDRICVGEETVNKSIGLLEDYFENSKEWLGLRQAGRLLREWSSGVLDIIRDVKGIPMQHLSEIEENSPLAEYGYISRLLLTSMERSAATRQPFGLVSMSPKYAKAIQIGNGELRDLGPDSQYVVSVFKLPNKVRAGEEYKPTFESRIMS